jgi:hypothetical protein
MTLRADRRSTHQRIGRATCKKLVDLRESRRNRTRISKIRNNAVQAATCSALAASPRTLGRSASAGKSDVDIDDVSALFEKSGDDPTTDTP